MRVCLSSRVVPALAAVLLVVPLYGGEPSASPKPDVASHVRSVTVFPIVLGSGTPIAGVPADMSKNVAELVGLFLERGGMKEIEIVDATFAPPKEADLAKLSEAFGQFVQSRTLATEYALCGQFLGTPGKGVDEIRLVVADRQGKVVLTKCLDRQQLLLKRMFSGEDKVCPMLASYYTVDALRGFWGLADPNRKDAPEGKLAKLWNEKSGVPAKSEQKAMQSRLDTLKKNINTSTVAVFPVRMSGKSDAQAAERLAQMLAKAGLGRARVDGVDPNLQIQPNTNQTRILWDTARAFQGFLRKHPPTADYALLTEYGIGRSHDGKVVVGGVQFVLCDHNSDWVLLELRNDDHPDFRRINPQSPDDCGRLVVEAMEKALRSGVKP
jgi:hypothetical protein